MSKGGHTAVAWRELVDAALGGLGVLAGGEFVRANDALAQAYGYEGGTDLVGRPWRELFGAPERRHIEETVLPGVESDGSWRGQVTGRRADGTVVDQELSVRRLNDDHLAWAVSPMEQTRTNGETPRTAPTGSRNRGRGRNGSDDGPPDRADRAELERYETIVETVDDGVYVLNDDLTFAFVNEVFCDIVGQSRESLLGTPVMDLFVDEEEAAFADEMREHVVSGDTTTGTVEGTIEHEDGTVVHTEARYRLHPDAEDGFAGSVGVVRDITERKAREERLGRQRDELAALGRVTELLHEVIRELFAARTRERIERVVCDRLAESEFYRFAWVGERAAEGDRVVPRVAAGDGDGYLDVLDVTVGDDPAGNGPAGRALRTGTVQVSQDIGSDPAFEPWREAALDRGFESAAAVPLVCEDTTYGVLAIYASRPGGFSEREQAGLAVLGETIGFALRARDDRRLLFADAVVELEFRSTDPELVLVPVSASLGCRLKLDGHLATGDGDWVAYLEVDGGAATAIGRELEDQAVVGCVRVIRGDEEGGLLEVTFGTGSFLDRMSNLGARVVSATAGEGAVRVGLEAPASADTRDLVGRLESAYPETELLARSEYDRSVGEVDLPGGPLDSLTDRQRQVLETTYRAGYFDWPRESTGEEVAATLDVAAPTLHAHLRKAEERLLSELLD